MSRRRVDPCQIERSLAAAPESVRQHGLRAAHPRPLVSLGKRAGRPFTSYRTSPIEAWQFPEIEYGNAGSSIAALVLDCDSPHRLEALADLPPYNWRVDRRANGHAHVVWSLAKPVHRYPAARIEPLRFLAAIGDYYAHSVSADPSYAGVLAHNPAPLIRQIEFRTSWWREEPYTLDELAKVIPFGWSPPKIRQTGIGRNHDLFVDGMVWAGKWENRHLSVLPALMVRNQQFDHPLLLSEVHATARSIEKYRARWAARGWNKPAWVAKQRMVGAKGGAAGLGKAQKNSASPEGSNEALRPWDAEGVSRRTWYRRRAARKMALIANTDKRGIAPLLFSIAV